MGNCYSNTIYFNEDDIIDMISEGKYIVSDGKYVYDVSYLHHKKHPGGYEIFKKYLSPKTVKKHIYFHNQKTTSLLKKLIIGKYKSQ